MALEGKLGYRDIAELIKTIDVRKKSGVMSISCGDRSATLRFIDGELINAESCRFSDRLGDILVGRGYLDRDALGRALELQQREGGKRRLGEILSEELGVGGPRIQRALSDQYKAIVFDVLSWPGGSFTFEVGEVAHKDKFGLAAADFILRVGLESGFLARDSQANGSTVPVAVVDADVAFCQRFASFLGEHGFAAGTASSGEEALALLDETSGQVVAVSLENMELTEGLVERIRALETKPFLLAYGHSNTRWRDSGIAPHADAYLVRPGPAELQGAEGERLFEVFMRMVQGILHTAGGGKDDREGL